MSVYVSAQNFPGTLTKEGISVTKPNGPGFFPATFVRNRRALDITRISTNTPNFRKPKTKGTEIDLPVNPFTFERHDRMLPYGTYEVDKHFGQCVFNFDSYSGVVTEFVSLSMPELSLSAAESASIDAHLDTKFRLKVKDQMVNIAQMYGERKQTANLLATTAGRIASSFGNLKRGNFAGAARVLGLSVRRDRNSRYRERWERDPQRAAAAGWLELQYGWVPLLSDVYGSAELIAQKVARHYKERVSASVTVYRKTMSRSATQVVTVAEMTETRKIYAWFGPPANSHTLAQIGLTNPAHLAWELLPYSFVVDWFIPVGNYLSSLDADLGTNFIKGGRTTFKKATTTVHQIWEVRYGPEWDYPQCNQVANPPVLREAWNWNASRKVVRCYRTPIFSVPGPSFPSFKNPFSMTHAANAISLLVQTFKR